MKLEIGGIRNPSPFGGGFLSVWLIIRNLGKWQKSYGKCTKKTSIG